MEPKTVSIRSARNNETSISRCECCLGADFGLMFYRIEVNPNKRVILCAKCAEDMCYKLTTVHNVELEA